MLVEEASSAPKQDILTETHSRVTNLAFEVISRSGPHITIDCIAISDKRTLNDIDVGIVSHIEEF